MTNYKPPYTITAKMLEYVASVSEKVGSLKNRSHLETRPHLRRNNRIKSIHSSLRIEANSLSLSEVRDVINGRMVLGDRQEIHGIMTAGIVRESGDFRKGEEGVFSGGKPVYLLHRLPIWFRI